MDNQYNLLFFASKASTNPSETMPHHASKLLLDKIHAENMLDNFRLIDIIDLQKKNIKIPTEITDIPCIIIPNIAKPLFNLDAHMWIQNSKYLNQKTNNSQNIIHNPHINEDTSMFNNSKSKHEDFSCIDEKDNIQRANIKYNAANENKKLTDLNDIHKQIKEYKITADTQTKDLNKLILQRKEQIALYMKSKK